jgi:UDP-N-acetylglucosamine transferase subunit ALG13
LSGPDATERLRSIGIAADAAGLPFEELRAEFMRRYPGTASLPPADVPDHVFPGLFGGIAAPQLVDAAARIAREWPAELIVNDAAELGGPIAAASAGIPSVTHGFGALTPIHRVRAAAEVVAPLWRSVGLEPRPFCGLYDHLYLDIYPASLQVADMTHVPRSHLLRPVAFDDAGDESSWVPATAPDAAPLVYLTLGTVQREHTVVRIALESIAAQNVDVLVTVGPRGDPAALGPQPDHVRVERYVPQTRVLRHCAVVVSHAGSGTFLATLAAGVPQLCLPQAADQFLNADACQRSGAGLLIQPGAATGAAIGDAVSRLLAEDSFRDRAAVVAAEIAAMPSPAEVAGVLEGLAA